jgi:hypothetical protein
MSLLIKDKRNRFQIGSGAIFKDDFGLANCIAIDVGDAM